MTLPGGNGTLIPRYFLAGQRPGRSFGGFNKMSVALNTKHLSSFISEEEYAAIYPQVEAAHKQLEAKNGQIGRASCRERV